MSIEQSHGRARPTLPRSSDLPKVETVPNPTVGRGPGGLFAAGNPHGKHARERHALKKLLGPRVGDEIAMMVARDARKLFAACLRELPHSGANVRAIVAMQARHSALAAYYTARAAELGLDTPEGAEADDRAMKHGQRAERLAVTALDISTRLAGAKRAPTALEILSTVDVSKHPLLVKDDDG